MSTSDELEKRCAASGLKIEYHDPQEEGGQSYTIITEPNSEWPWSLVFLGLPGEEEAILASGFEKYRPLSGYDATWSKSEKCIECELICESQFLQDEDPIEQLRSVFGLGPEAGGLKDTNIYLPTATDSPRISIGWNSPEHHVWRCASPAAHQLWNKRVPVLRIDGVTVSTDAEARRALEAYGVAALLEIERSVGFKARLGGHYPWRVWLDFERNRPSASFRPLKAAPEIEPVSLYWQGRSAGTLPAQFLGFYQVLEYYFPRCSRMAFVEELREAVSLSALSQDEVSKKALRLLENAAKKKGSPIGREEYQLKCTLKAIVTDAELRSLIDDSPRLREHYQKHEQGFVSANILLASSGTDIREVAAKRIYGIRCRIVHTKEDGDSGVKVFLPLSAEAAELYHDVVLVGLLARKALDEMSVPLPGV